jgi:hypothetical protein
MTTPINPARIANAKKKSRCMKSKDSNHQWKEVGIVPGAQQQCIYCNIILNWK